MIVPSKYPVLLPSWLCEVFSQHPEAGVIDPQTVQSLTKDRGVRVVLEGLPGTGKTTLVAMFECQTGGRAISQFVMPIDPALGDDQYLKNDLKKDQLLTSATTPAVMDRDYTSTLAFLHASQRRGRYEDILRQIQQGMGKTFHLPDVYVYLKVSPATSIARKSQASREAIWNNLGFLSKMTRFYEDYFSYMKRICAVVEIDTEEKSMSEVFDLLTQVAGQEAGHD